MYCGSVEHAEIIEETIREFPNVTANINLFWAFSRNESEASYIARWMPLLQRAITNPRLKLTVAKARQRDDFQAAFGVALSIAPHPSPTFSDGVAAELLDAPEHVISGVPTILFPGGMRPEKGFQISVATAIKLADEMAVTCKLRALKADNTPEAMVDLLNKLDDPAIHIESRDKIGRAHV